MKWNSQKDPIGAALLLPVYDSRSAYDFPVTQDVVLAAAKILKESGVEYIAYYQEGVVTMAIRGDGLDGKEGLMAMVRERWLIHRAWGHQEGG